MGNLLFISGPHGGGKTTLVKQLCEQSTGKIMIPELVTQVPKLKASYSNRLAIKIAQRTLENYESFLLAKQNPDKIILGNRCIYDAMAYDNAYYLRGWVSMEEKSFLDRTTEAYFNSIGIGEPFAIVLNPSLEVLVRHLENRWKNNEKKWHEEDFQYLAFARESFEMFKDNPLVYYIDHEIDLNGNDTKELLEWIDQTYYGNEVMAQKFGT